MTPHDDDAPDARLAARLAALPREATPPAGTWSRIVAAERARRRGRWWRGSAVAAGLVATVGMWTFASSRTNARADSRSPDRLRTTMLDTAVLLEETRDPRWHAAVQELQSWHVAVADSGRSAGWPAAAQQAVLSAVAVTEAELSAVRAAIAAQPATDAQRRHLLDQLATLRAQQVEQLQRARALLDQL